MRWLLLSFLGVAYAFQPNSTELKSAVDACIDLVPSGDCCRADDGTMSNANGLDCQDGVHLVDWDTQMVDSMEMLFADKYNFSQPVGVWDTSSVTNMAFMMINAAAFDDDLSHWDTSRVTSMYHMFSFSGFTNGASIASWDVRNVTNINFMFVGTQNFKDHVFCTSAWREYRNDSFVFFSSGGNNTISEDDCCTDGFGYIKGECTPCPLPGQVNNETGTGCVCPEDTECVDPCATDDASEYINNQCCRC